MKKLVVPAFDPRDLPEQSSSGYPEPYKSRVAGRHRRRLGDAAGLKNFGVNLTRLDSGAESSMRHWHTKQDEFIYVLEGEVTLVTEAGRQKLEAGMAAGFPAPGDGATYSEADLAAKLVDGKWVFTHKDGSSYT